MLPIHLDLTGRRVVCIGAGTVALRRVRTFVDAGAEVVVIAPQFHPQLDVGSELGSRVERAVRPYEPGDLRGAWLAHIATDDAAVNAAAADEARLAGIWALRADDATASDAHLPAVLVTDGATVSVACGDPGRSAAIRTRIAAGFADGSLTSPRTRRAADEPGSVTLVGGGPGDAGLITVRGLRALLDADVVVVDRLAPLGLLELLREGVEIIDAGKRPDHHTLTQDEINAVLVNRARSGARVVRLKGGDPFVLGRGSEEVLACAAAGIAVEVIPGVTSAIAAPAAAGIPVTHRGITTGFAVLSGHEVGPEVTAIARSGVTAVLLMGVATLPAIVEAFVLADRERATPVAIIERATGDAQRTTIGTLESIVTQAATARVENPAVIVIGDVVHALDEARVLASTMS